MPFWRVGFPQTVAVTKLRDGTDFEHTTELGEYALYTGKLVRIERRYDTIVEIRDMCRTVGLKETTAYEVEAKNLIPLTGLQANRIFNQPLIEIGCVVMYCSKFLKKGGMEYALIRMAADGSCQIESERGDIYNAKVFQLVRI